MHRPLTPYFDKNTAYLVTSALFISIARYKMHGESTEISSAASLLLMKTWATTRQELKIDVKKFSFSFPPLLSLLYS